jgi:hypothetical protein
MSSCTSTPPYIFTARWLCKRRNKFTYTFTEYIGTFNIPVCNCFCEQFLAQWFCNRGFSFLPCECLHVISSWPIALSVFVHLDFWRDLHYEYTTTVSPLNSTIENKSCLYYEASSTFNAEWLYKRKFSYTIVVWIKSIWMLSMSAVWNAASCSQNVTGMGWIWTRRMGQHVE